MWGVGCILALMVTGKTPKNGLDLTDMDEIHQYEFETV